MARRSIGLKPEDFTKNLCKYGYIDEQLPACYSGNSFGDHIDDIIKTVEETEIDYASFPVNISIFKTQTSRRVISVPNPASFVYTVIFMKDNWKKIVEKSESHFSHSPITRISSYEGGTELNSPAMMDAKEERSDFISHIKERIGAAIGLRYKLQIDIETFYDSLYTHVAAWALCGKKRAKEMYLNADTRNENYLFADKFDERIRTMNCNETHGIITGPFTSRIFSEFVIANIDKRISEELRNGNMASVFRRYVDDYCFYFRSEHEAHQGLVIIESVLREYGLGINQNKIVFEEYPFDIIAPLKERLANAYFSDGENEKGGFFNVLNEAGRLYLEGEKGAYSYALKFLSEKNALDSIDKSDVKAVTSMLVDIAIQDARFNKYVLKIFNENRDAFKMAELETRLNELAYYALENHYEQELLNILFYLRELDLPISSRTLGRILESSNDLAILIALDYLNNRDDLIRCDDDMGFIDGRLERLKKQLSGEDMNGPRWMLKYECRVHGFSGIGYKPGGKNKFFDLLFKNGVHFYEAFEKPRI